MEWHFLKCYVQKVLYSCYQHGAYITGARDAVLVLSSSASERYGLGLFTNTVRNSEGGGWKREAEGFSETVCNYKTIHCHFRSNSNLLLYSVEILDNGSNIIS